MDDIVKELEAATISSRAEALLRLFREIWEHEVIPTKWKHSVVGKREVVCSRPTD